jgi:large subunit ribosomal protein L18
MSKSDLFHKKQSRLKRKMHIRKKISGTSNVPRISVFKSNKYTYFQVIDDINGVTLSAGSTLKGRSITDAVKDVFKSLQDMKVNKAVLDRNGYKYHGIVKLIADEFRALGLSI